MYAIICQHFQCKYLSSLFPLENTRCFEYRACMLWGIVSHAFHWETGYEVKSHTANNCLYK